jgi:tetratricopeptide (TPR) repeat protein
MEQGLVVLISLIIVIYIALFVTSPLITIFHEMGHALAYLILTKPDKLDIYIGSYGEIEKAWNFKIGKFAFHVKYAFPFIRGGGLCQCDKTETNYIKKIIILFAGPLFTVFMAAIIGFVVFSTNIHGSIKLYCFALIIFSISSLVANLKPRTIKRGKYGADLDNDGKQLAFVIKLKRLYTDYMAAYEFIGKGDMELAITKLRFILEKIPFDETILRLLVDSYRQIRHHREAAFYLSKLEENFEFTTNDILLKACLQSLTGNHNESIPNYREVLAYDNDNLIALNNLGYELTEHGEYQEAEQLLKKAIAINPKFDSAYSTLGYLKVLQGDWDAGKALIDESFELTTDAYAYKALGVYYLKTGDIDNANASFDKALEMDNSIDLSKYYTNANQQVIPFGTIA